ncbi:MAG TPA: Na+/H+ antiporter [Steroidobacteraceae bacterium]|nr:Na+/H+ antiporter [Steroidobacteraceae bacterium]
MTAFIVVMVCAIAAGWLAERIRVPYPIVLVLAGIGVGLAYGGLGLELDPQIVLAVVLPAVLYPAAVNTSWRDFRALLRPILLLAIGLVTTTTLAVGLAFKWLVPEVPWAVAFALGAVVSPPDAVAATAILRRFRLPRWIVTLLEGESLVNDATGLVLFRFAVAAALTGAFSGWRMIGEFGVIAVGGLAVGILAGWISAVVQERLRDPMLELSVSLTTPFATYWLCETFDVSGVLGVVAVGLYRSRWSHLGTSPLVRLNVRTFWAAVGHVVNCFVFLLIGVELPVIAAALLDQQSQSWGHVAFLVAVLSGVAIGVRFLWIFTATYGVRLLVPSLRKRDPASARVSTLVSWCGMRGVVTLAAALALPLVMPDGSPFPERELVILLAFGIVFVTLVGQGLTLPAVIRGLQLEKDRSAESEAEAARKAMCHAAIEAVDRLVAEDGIPPQEAEPVKRFFNNVLQHRPRGTPALDSDTRLWLSAAAAQREALLRLWRRGEIGDDVLTRLERDIDLAEARLARDD